MKKLLKEGTLLVKNMLFQKWKPLTLYCTFTVIVLNGWYLEMIGYATSNKDFASTFRAEHGNVGVYELIAFISGTILFSIYIIVDYFKAKLEKLEKRNVDVVNKSLIGDANQAMAQNSQNSPVVAGSGNTNISYNYYPFDDKRCREIFDEKWAETMKSQVAESREKVINRKNTFDEILLQRLKKVEDGFNSLADPAFLFQLAEAQKSASTTDRKLDYELLSELLAKRTKVGNDRAMQIGIKRAVEMLPFVPDEALTGLTMSFCIASLIPETGDIDLALKTLDNSYKLIIDDTNLPKGKGWLDALETANLVKIGFNSISSLKKSRDINIQKLKPLASPGILKNSDRYQQAVSNLVEVGLNEKVLVDHLLNDKYVRVNLKSVEDVESSKFEKDLGHGIKMSIIMSDNQKNALKAVFGLYETDAAIISDFENRLVDEMAKYPNLKKVNDWWDGLTYVFDLTMTGRILANANAKLHDSGIPIFGKEEIK